MMARHWTLAAIMALAGIPALGQLAFAKPPPGMSVREDLYLVATYDAARDPANDLAAAVAEAKRTGKRVLLDVGGEWCIWCHILDDFLSRNRDVGDAFAASFVITKISWTPDSRNEAFLAAYPQVSGYPHFFILDETGRLLKSQDTSPLERGDTYDRARMLAFAQSWRVN